MMRRPANGLASFTVQSEVGADIREALAKRRCRAADSD